MKKNIFKHPVSPVPVRTSWRYRLLLHPNYSEGGKRKVFFWKHHRASSKWLVTQREAFRVACLEFRMKAATVRVYTDVYVRRDRPPSLQKHRSNTDGHNDTSLTTSSSQIHTDNWLIQWQVLGLYADSLYCFPEPFLWVLGSSVSIVTK
jgi:hypothetical protein